MVTGLIALLACQVVGELVVRTLGLPVPGPILGMVLLLVLLEVRQPSSRSGLVQGAQTVLRHLPLLYVPAGVGVVVYLGLLGDHPVPLVVGLVVSWAAGLLTTAGVAALVLRVQRRTKAAA